MCRPPVVSNNIRRSLDGIPEGDSCPIRVMITLWKASETLIGSYICSGFCAAFNSCLLPS